MNVTQEETKKVNLVLNGTESEGEVIASPILGEKISSSGMLMDPYEAVLETTEEEVFQDVPEDHPEPEWMEEDEIDEGQPHWPTPEDFSKNQKKTV